MTFRRLRYVLGTAASIGVAAGIVFTVFYFSLTTIIDDIVINIPMADFVTMDIETIASGTKAEKNSKGIIDYSNTNDGYVMVKYKENTDKNLKVKVKCPLDVEYIYNIQPQEWVTLPLSLGNGEYTVSLYEHIMFSKYKSVLKVTFDAVMDDEFEVFLRPNQYVDYADAPKTIEMSHAICQGAETDVEKVNRIYLYVTENFKYDNELAESVASGYVPDLDAVLEKKTGICFDYAALTAAMLRVQGIPCQLIVGYTKDIYHAWIRVYFREKGVIDNAIGFDGNTWHRFDPTFASTAGHNDAKIIAYIENDENYDIKYYY